MKQSKHEMDMEVNTAFDIFICCMYIVVIINIIKTERK